MSARGKSNSLPRNKKSQKGWWKETCFEKTLKECGLVHCGIFSPPRPSHTVNVERENTMILELVLTSFSKKLVLTLLLLPTTQPGCLKDPHIMLYKLMIVQKMSIINLYFYFLVELFNLLVLISTPKDLGFLSY